MPELSTDRDVLRHFLAALAYRFRHVTEGAPPGFPDLEAGAGVRTPRRIVRHMTGLLLMALEPLAGAAGAEARRDLGPLPWEEERRRFLQVLAALDRAVAGGAEPRGDKELWQLWQGPMIDAMTHVGQLATLRRLAGEPVGAVRYWQVEMPPATTYEPEGPEG